MFYSIDQKKLWIFGFPITEYYLELVVGSREQDVRVQLCHSDILNLTEFNIVLYMQACMQCMKKMINQYLIFMLYFLSYAILDACSTKYVEIWDTFCWKSADNKINRMYF